MYPKVVDLLDKTCLEKIVVRPEEPPGPFRKFVDVGNAPQKTALLDDPSDDFF
jgi:hypothetical protein